MSSVFVTYSLSLLLKKTGVLRHPLLPLPGVFRLLPLRKPLVRLRDLGKLPELRSSFDFVVVEEVVEEVFLLMD